MWSDAAKGFSARRCAFSCSRAARVDDAVDAAAAETDERRDAAALTTLGA